MRSDRRKVAYPVLSFRVRDWARLYAIALLGLAASPLLMGVELVERIAGGRR